MVNINGIRVGSASSPGSWGIYVGGTQYISSNLRVDGEIQQGGTDYGGYEIQTGGQLYVNDYAVALGGIHVGGTSDPGTDNLIVDGNVGVGTASPSEQVEVRNTSGQAKIKIRGDGSTATTRAELMMDRTNSARGAGVRMQNSNAGTDAQWFAGIPYNNGSSSTGYSIGTHASQPEYTTRSKLFIKTDGNVGIGTTSPGAKLQVSGQVKITGGSPGAGKVLTSDANGLATWETSGYGNVPVGSVIAWHKSLSGTPSLPTGWAECNGQTISDASSPYNGQSIPNMNGTFTTLPGTTSSGGRFIRGGTTSGGFEQDQSNRLYQVHADDSGSGTTTGTISESGWSGYRRNYSTSGDRVYYRLNGRETRPGSIKMVWIMRVK
jgi:hypothetical protein